MSHINTTQSAQTLEACGSCSHSEDPSPLVCRLWFLLFLPPPVTFHLVHTAISILLCETQGLTDETEGCLTLPDFLFSFLKDHFCVCVNIYHV